jgi:hypothetical protein
MRNVPPTDEDTITSNVTKILSAKSHEQVPATMLSLRVLLRPPNNKFLENRNAAFRRGAHLAVVHAMRQNANSDKIQEHGLGILASISCCKIGNICPNPDIVALGGLDWCLGAMQQDLAKHLYKPAAAASFTIYHAIHAFGRSSLM